jgi:hypothetical protein
MRLIPPQTIQRKLILKTMMLNNTMRLLKKIKEMRHTFQMRLLLIGQMKLKIHTMRLLKTIMLPMIMRILHQKNQVKITFTQMKAILIMRLMQAMSLMTAITH